MSYTNVDAYNDMVAAVEAGVQSLTTTYGIVPTVLYKGVKQAVAPLNDKVMQIRVTTNTTADRKRTLSVPSRVTKQGLIVLQILYPKTQSQVNLTMRQYTDLFERCLHRQSGGVVFYNVISKEMPDDSAFFIWQIQGTFNYDIMEG